MYKKLLFGTVLTLALSVGAMSIATPVFAIENTVRTTLCDPGSTPLVDIYQPVSDSVVDTPDVELSGTSQFTTQLDIYINDVYSQSLAIEPDGLFSVNIPLQEGNNTIRVDSYFSCNQTSSTNGVVVTYQPAVEPSAGGDVDTDVTNSPTSGEGTIVSQPSEEDSLLDKIFIDPFGANGEDPFARITLPVVYIVGLVVTAITASVVVFTSAFLVVFGLSGAEELLWGFSLRFFTKLISFFSTAVLLVLLLI